MTSATAANTTISSMDARGGRQRKRVTAAVVLLAIARLEFAIVSPTLLRISTCWLAADGVAPE
jgi:hypothetical protein